ncbi:DUF3592 domain-containing protein [Jannaschia formosa]|uniref:DUF3592 domain-containing protein n=1 Tax=Jannaschia formosa TaxID=2259592 RepID=UPI0010752948|nr:DUF3592 domain-containing protein [Jannaschia formosa]TFL15959.1 DUF3592 domain-containing protein [Jannaschia formosa]
MKKAARRAAGRSSSASRPRDLDRDPHQKEILALVLILCGLGFGAIGLASWASSGSIAACGARATGEVVEVVRFGPHDRREPRPVLRFTTEDGRAVVATSVTGVSRLEEGVGDRMALRYDPGAPERMVAGSSLGPILRSAVPLVAALWFLAAGARWLGWRPPGARRS